MLPEPFIRTFASHWIKAWNAHDLDAILAHYSPAVVLTSPVASKLLGRSSGTVRGKIALKHYFKTGLAAYPNLKFKLLDVFGGMDSVVLHYVNQNRSQTAEFMQFNKAGKVSKVIAHYSRPIE